MLVAFGLAIVPWDGPVSRWATSLRLGGDVKREMEVAQQFGDLISISLSAILIWLLDPTRRRVLWLGAASIACAGALGTVAKMAIGRPRPKFGDPAFLGPWGTFDTGGPEGARHAWEFWRGHWADLTSMPSSHMLFAAALATFLAFAYPRLGGLVAVLAVLVGIARVVLGAHYPSEVFVGGAMGWYAGSVGIRLVQRIHPAITGVGTSACPLGPCLPGSVTKA